MKDTETIRIAESRLTLVHDHGKMTAAWHNGEKLDMSGNQVFYAMFKEIAALREYLRIEHDALQRVGSAAGMLAGSNLIEEIVPAIFAIKKERDDLLAVAREANVTMPHAPLHVRAMAGGILRQCDGAHPREEIDLTAARAVAHWIITEAP